MKEFFQSGSEDDYSGVDLNEDAHTDLADFEYMDETSSGRGEVVTDNDRDALDTSHFVSTVDTSDLTGTIHDKVNAMLNRLQTHLEEGAR
jgi:hypothetical protein